MLCFFCSFLGGWSLIEFVFFFLGGGGFKGLTGVL